MADPKDKYESGAPDDAPALPRLDRRPMDLLQKGEQESTEPQATQSLLLLQAADGLARLAVEVYGGPILATFADRDLSLAGRVMLR